MESLPEFNKPAYYEFRVRGRLTSRSASWFEDMKVAIDETVTPVQTVLRGYILDQAALYGMIGRIRDLGLTLLSVNQLDQKEDP
jgi:hypothetical protein